MSYVAKILAHSISKDGFQLCTFELRYPRMIHSEMLTHRMFSRNSASTRAIPTLTQVKNLLEHPYIPSQFGENKPGMQSDVELVGERHTAALNAWYAGRDRAVTTALELTIGANAASEILGYEPSRDYVLGKIVLEKFDGILNFAKNNSNTEAGDESVPNVHKQLSGRVLESYSWITVVVSATEFSNFFALRDHKDAQWEIAEIAQLMRSAYEQSEPTQLDYGQWHLPYVSKGEFDNNFDALRSSVARTAAVSYDRQAVKDFGKEVSRYEKLLSAGHMSPFEHQATPFTKLDLDRRIITGFPTTMFSGNFRGFTQYRQTLEHPEEYNGYKEYNVQLHT